ncbi:MAG TPA: cupin domain-containing protein [Candidatus Thermoplasmatota archaeon]|nr:cupin domain-containing protein [Candidatus Thermoplasmatota archaeon]
MLWTSLPERAGPFFEVLHTTPRTQTAFMTIAPGEEAGPTEVHETQDQVIYVVRGEILARVGGGSTPKEVRGGPGSLLVIEAGTPHWVKSVGKEPLLFLTVYGPPAY